MTKKSSFAATQIIASRVAQVSELNAKFPNWNKNDIELAKTCFNHLSDYDLNKDGYKTLIKNSIELANYGLTKKVVKFVEKRNINLKF